jgi:hypothetical protein
MLRKCHITMAQPGDEQQVFTASLARAQKAEADAVAAHGDVGGGDAGGVSGPTPNALNRSKPRRKKQSKKQSTVNVAGRGAGGEEEEEEMQHTNELLRTEFFECVVRTALRVAKLRKALARDGIGGAVERLLVDSLQFYTKGYAKQEHENVKQEMESSGRIQAS